MKESFSELFTRLYNENITELEKLRKKEKSKTVISGVIACAVFVFGLIKPKIALMLLPGLLLILFILIIIGLFVKKKNNKKGYISCFKEKVIAPLVSNIFEDGKYEPNNGLTKSQYMAAEYKDDIDRYESEDLITAKITLNDNVKSDLQFSEVHTMSKHTDSDGHSSYSTEFRGLAGEMQLGKDVGTKIYIRNNSEINKATKNRVKLDMSEFENKFDVECEDKILAVRLLTSDVMTEMLELYNKFKYKFEIHILNQKIYMRLHTGEMFEPEVFQSSMEFQIVQRYYLALQATMDVFKHINEKIIELEI